MRRLGVLGGTFDPVHFGHLDAGRAADAALHFTELIVVPSLIPPHRPQPFASSYHRFAMVALAVAGRDRWRVSDLELLQTEPSFTAATLDRLHQAGFAPIEIFFIVGADAFADISTWRHFPEILDGAHFAVVSRPGCPVEAMPARLPSLASRMIAASEAMTATSPGIVVIPAETADVSSTTIRSRQARGEPLDGLVPSAVAGHIRQHGLYLDAALRDTNGAPHGPAAGRLHGQD